MASVDAWRPHEPSSSPAPLRQIGPDDVPWRHRGPFLTKVPCFLVSVRDPVERLESGCRFELARPASPHDRDGSHPHMVMTRLLDKHGNLWRVNASLHDFVRALASESHPAHDYAWRQVRRASYVNPVEYRRWDGETLVDMRAMSPFLVPQSAYVSRIRCDRMALYAQCTTRDTARVARGWASLLATFGMRPNRSTAPGAAAAAAGAAPDAGRRPAAAAAAAPAAAAAGSLPESAFQPRHNRSGGFDTRSEAALPQSVLDGYTRCALSEARDRAFVRRVLFAADHELFRALCFNESVVAGVNYYDDRFG